MQQAHLRSSPKNRQHGTNMTMSGAGVMGLGQRCRDGDPTLRERTGCRAELGFGPRLVSNTGSRGIETWASVQTDEVATGPRT